MEQIEKRGRLKEKHERWKRMRHRLEQATDIHDQRIEGRIFSLVVACNLMGLPTTSSCEGHLLREGKEGALRLISPHIFIKPLHEPSERFVGQRQLLRELAEKYGVPYKKTEYPTKRDSISRPEGLLRTHRTKGKPAWDEFWRVIKEKGYPETHEYKMWREEEQKLVQRLRQYLREFYRNRPVPTKMHYRLTIKRVPHAKGARPHVGFCLTNRGVKGEDSLPVSVLFWEWTSSSPHFYQRILRQQCEEMQRFGEFLMQKYWRSEASVIKSSSS